MTQPTPKKEYPFDRPGTYCIRVLGMVDESWSNRLAGMKINTVKSKNLEPITTLTGSVPDQAALSGVLETLYELHLTLLSVEMLEDNNMRQGSQLYQKSP
jgi:hypothetical protein